MRPRYGKISCSLTSRVNSSAIGASVYQHPYHRLPLAGSPGPLQLQARDGQRVEDCSP
jgi:hypothetical protein